MSQLSTSRMRTNSYALYQKTSQKRSSHLRWVHTSVMYSSKEIVTGHRLGKGNDVCVLRTHRRGSMGVSRRYIHILHNYREARRIAGIRVPTIVQRTFVHKSQKV